MAKYVELFEKMPLDTKLAAIQGLIEFLRCRAIARRKGTIETVEDFKASEVASLENGWDYNRFIYRAVDCFDEDGFYYWEERKFSLNLPKMEDSEYNTLSEFLKTCEESLDLSRNSKETEEEEVMKSVIYLLSFV